MTKRSIDNDLSDVSEHILGDLDPENRLRLTLEAWADGDETRNERLMETVPRCKGSFPDPQFAERHRQVTTLSLDATRTLETGVWKFHWARAEGRYKDAMWQAWGSEKGGEEGWEFLEEPTPENGFHEEVAMEMAARFLKNYHLYTWFAEEQLDVSLEEFLSLSSIPGENATFDLIENAAKMADGRMHEELNDGDEDGLEPYPDFEPGWGEGVTFAFAGEQRTAEEAAEFEYEALANAWEETEPS